VCVLSYRCVLIQCVLLYRCVLIHVCCHKRCVLIQLCSHTVCAVIQVCSESSVHVSWGEIQCWTELSQEMSCRLCSGPWQANNDISTFKCSVRQVFASYWSHYGQLSLTHGPSTLTDTTVITRGPRAAACPHSELLSVARSQELKAISFLNNIKWFICAKERQYVFCERKMLLRRTSEFRGLRRHQVVWVQKCIRI